MTRMGLEINASLSQFEGTADEARSSLGHKKRLLQGDVGHPLVHDELPEVPLGGQPGAGECEAIRKLLGHSRWRCEGANIVLDIESV